MENMYKPFKLKIENADIFVGFQPFFDGGRIQFSIATRTISEMLTSGRPNFVHAKSNVSEKQIEGTITGAILRCLDCSSDREQCTAALQSTLAELCLLKFSPKLFLRCLYKLQKRYEIMSEFIREFRIFSAAHA